MPILQCPNCGYVVVYRGKALALGDCPNDCTNDSRRTPTLHVDRDHLERLNGHTIDGSHDGHEERRRRMEALDRRLSQQASDRAAGD